jgi:hypothetical protein
MSCVSWDPATGDYIDLSDPRGAEMAAIAEDHGRQMEELNRLITGQDDRHDERDFHEAWQEREIERQLEPRF